MLSITHARHCWHWWHEACSCLYGIHILYMCVFPSVCPWIHYPLCQYVCTLQMKRQSANVIIGAALFFVFINTTLIESKPVMAPQNNSDVEAHDSDPKVIKQSMFLGKSCITMTSRVLVSRMIGLTIRPVIPNRLTKLMLLTMLIWGIEHYFAADKLVVTFCKELIRMLIALGVNRAIDPYLQTNGRRLMVKLAVRKLVETLVFTILEIWPRHKVLGHNACVCVSTLIHCPLTLHSIFDSVLCDCYTVRGISNRKTLQF